MFCQARFKFFHLCDKGEIKLNETSRSDSTRLRGRRWPIILQLGLGLGVSSSFLFVSRDCFAVCFAIPMDFRFFWCYATSLALFWNFWATMLLFPRSFALLFVLWKLRRHLFRSFSLPLTLLSKHSFYYWLSLLDVVSLLLSTFWYSFSLHRGGLVLESC